MTTASEGRDPSPAAAEGRDLSPAAAEVWAPFLAADEDPIFEIPRRPRAAAPNICESMKIEVVERRDRKERVGNKNTASD